jgi:hypothetical protein
MKVGESRVMATMFMFALVLVLLALVLALVPIWDRGLMRRAGRVWDWDWDWSGGLVCVKRTRSGGEGRVWSVPVGAVAAPPMVVTVLCEVCEAVERMEGVARRLEERRGLDVEGDGEGEKGKENGLRRENVGEVVLVILDVVVSSWSGGKGLRGVVAPEYDFGLWRGLVVVGETPNVSPFVCLEARDVVRGGILGPLVVPARELRDRGWLEVDGDAPGAGPAEEDGVLLGGGCPFGADG